MNRINAASSKINLDCVTWALSIRSPQCESELAPDPSGLGKREGDTHRRGRDRR